MSFLSKIRSTEARMPLGKMALNTAAVLLLGIALGVFFEVFGLPSGVPPAISYAY